MTSKQDFCLFFHQLNSIDRGEHPFDIEQARMLNAPRCLDVIDRNYFLSAPLKSRCADESKLVGDEAEGCAEDTQSILHASLEID